MFPQKIKNWVDSKVSSDYDHEIYKRVEEIKKNVFEFHARQKEIQKEYIKIALENSEDEDKDELKKILERIEEQEQESMREAEIRRERLQAIVDVQIRRIQ